MPIQRTLKILPIKMQIQQLFATQIDNK